MADGCRGPMLMLHAMHSAGGRESHGMQLTVQMQVEQLHKAALCIWQLPSLQQCHCVLAPLPVSAVLQGQPARVL
jgi:hypothetical protein